MSGKFGWRAKTLERKPGLTPIGSTHGSHRQRDIVAGRKTVMLAERTDVDAVYDRNKRGKRIGLVFQRHHAPGTILGNPENDLAHWLRRKLNAAVNPVLHPERRRADCNVYDAAGKLIAVIDGETRERRPV